MATQDGADGLGVLRLHRGDVEPELEPGSAPGDPDDLVTERLLGELLAVGGAGQGDAGVGVQVVDVGGVDEGVHGRVDRGGGAALAEQAVVEGGDHLVLALHPRVHRAQGADAVQAQHRQPVGRQGAEVAPGPLTHSRSTAVPVTGSVAVP